MKPRAITDIAIKELSLILPYHKGAEWQAVNPDAKVLMVKGAEVKPDDKKNVVLRALNTIKGYFTADYQAVPYPVTEAEDNIDNDGDGPEDYNAIVSAVCGLYNDLSQQFCVSDDAARSAGIVNAIDSFLAGLDDLRKGNDEKAGARHSAQDMETLQKIAAAHQVIDGALKDLGITGAEGPVSEETGPEVDEGPDSMGEDEKAKKPYGDVEYADTKNNKYPIDTEEHARAAWSYINQDKNAAEYSAEKLAEVKARIEAACKKFGIEINDNGNKAGEVEMTQEEINALVADAAAKAAEAAVAKAQEAAQAQIDAAKAEAQAKIDEANAAAESAKAQAQADAEKAAQAAAEAEALKAEAVKAARTPSGASATTVQASSRLQDAVKAALVGAGSSVI